MIPSISRATRPLALILGLGFATGCGLEELESAVITAATDTVDHQTELPDVEACEHLDAGPSIAVQAVRSVTDPTLPDVGAAHTRYDVAFTDVTDGQGGWVRLPVAAAGDYVAFLNDDVPLAAFAADGTTAIAAEDAEDHSEACATVAGRYVFELSVGETMLWFGPSTTSAVSIVVEAASTHDDHDHED